MSAVQYERSIRSRLRFLVLGVALPLVLLAVFSIWTDFASSLRSAESQTDRLASTVAASVSRYFTDALAIAKALVEHPDVRSLDPARCEQTLPPVSNALPNVTNLVVNRADGTLVCTVVPLPDDRGLDVSARPWVQAAVASGEVTVSPPIMGRISQALVTSIIVPFRGDNNEVAGILTMALGLEALQALLVDENPDGRLVTITDTSFIVVARSLDPEDWIRVTLPLASASDAADMSIPAGYNTAEGADGIRRLFAYQRIEGTPWLVWAGIPTSQIYASALAPLYPKLGLAALTILFVLLYARTMNRQIQTSLSGLTAEMKDADSTPRGLVRESGPQEIAEVARQYNRLLQDRRNAEAAAAASADLNDLVMRASSDALWDWDLATGRIEGNRRFVETFAGPHIDLGQGDAFWTSRVHPDDAANMTVRNDDLLSGSTDSASSDFRIRRADGTWAEVLDRCHAVRGENGRPVRLFGAMMDVSVTREAQRKVEQARARYRAVLQNAAIGIYVAKLDGTLIEANPAFLSMFGIERAEALALTEGAFFVNPEELERAVLASAPGSKAVPQETSWRTPSGRVLSVRFFRNSFVDETGQTAVEVMAEDLTEHKRLEEQFRQAQKMEAMGQLAGGVAHDFNNRLTVIQGRAELVKSEVGANPDLLESMDAILESAAGAAKLTRELLAVSRKQIYRPQVLSMNTIVERLGPMFDALLGETYGLEMILPEGLPSVSVDPGHIQQILINIIINARDAQPSGGRITVRTYARVVSAEEAASTAGLVEGSYVALTVSDQGTGMLPGVLERVFEPFFTTKAIGLGTGLGLATVYGLAKQNDGFVSITSEVGRGTQVEVLFPEAVDDPDAPASADGPTAASGDGATVLIVEDELGVRSVIARTLAVLGYSVIEAHSGEAALSLPDEVWNEVSVVVTDIVMPGIRGTEVAERVRVRFPALPVLFISGYRDDPAAMAACEEPDRAFLSKPFTPQELGFNLGKLLRNRRGEPQVTPVQPPKGV